jgi:aspartate 1-decarboxylase
MQRHMFKSKIHRATITSADLHYEGSLTVDEDLLDAADLVTYEEIQVVNVNNGQRFTTYVIPGPRGSGVIQLNGAAARLGLPGDLVILISYGVFDDKDARKLRPNVVHVDARNRIVRPALRAEG